MWTSTTSTGRAVIAARLDGAEGLLERDEGARARGFRHLLEGREGPGAYLLAATSRRTALFRGGEEAVDRLLNAADAAGVPHERALRAALLGVLQASVPRV